MKKPSIERCRAHIRQHIPQKMSRGMTDNYLVNNLRRYHTMQHIRQGFRRLWWHVCGLEPYSMKKPSIECYAELIKYQTEKQVHVDAFDTRAVANIGSYHLLRQVNMELGVVNLGVHKLMAEINA